MNMRITLPYPPSTNTYYRHIVVNGRPRTVISKRGREYRNAVLHALSAGGWTKRNPVEGDMQVDMLLVPSDFRRRDIDNYNKALLDAITHSATVWLDDSQIKSMTVRLGVPDKDDPRVDVTISTLEQNNDN